MVGPRSDKLPLCRIWMPFNCWNSGSIDRGEFEQALKELHFSPTRDELNALMNRFDRDGNGEVSYKEFIKFVRNGGSSGGRRLRKT